MRPAFQLPSAATFQSRLDLALCQNRRMSVVRRAWVVLLLALLLCPSPRADSDALIEQLGPDAETLRSQFNQDAETVRMLLILDPT